MTCREKLAKEHPESVDAKWVGGCEGCPTSYGYLINPEYCDSRSEERDILCTKCWDREIPEEKQEEKSGETKIINDLDKVSHRIGKVHEILKDYGLRSENITEIILKLLPLIITESGDIGAVIKILNGKD